MGLIDEYERIDTARKLYQYVGNITNYVKITKDRLNDMVAIKTESPSDAPEIDALIAQLKAALQNIIDTY